MIKWFRTGLAWAVWAWMLAGCFPEENRMGNLSFQLSIDELGFENAQRAISDWLDWLDGDPANPAFDMGLDGRGFFLALQLDGMAPDGLVAFQGKDVSVSDTLLEVNLAVSECTRCSFSAVIFWEEVEAAPGLSTFAGTSDVFDVTEYGVVQPNPVDMNVYLEPTGSILCSVDPQGYQGEVTLAAFDVGEGVIFPPAVPVLSDGQAFEVELRDIPVDRPVHVLVKLQGDLTYAAEPGTVDPVTVIQADSTTPVSISL